VLQMADDHDGQPLVVWCQVKEPKLEPTLFVPREPLPKKPYGLVDALPVVLVSLALKHPRTFQPLKVF